MSQYFFEGEFKKKKEISLRDTKNNQILTKATLLSKVQDERNARLQKKQQELATLTLMKYLNGWRVRTQYRLEFKNLHLKPNLNRLATLAQNHSLSIPLWIETARFFLFVYPIHMTVQVSENDRQKERFDAFALLVKAWLHLSFQEMDEQKERESLVQMTMKCILFSFHLLPQLNGKVFVHMIAAIQTFLKSCFSENFLSEAMRFDLAHLLLQKKNEPLFHTIHTMLQTKMSLQAMFFVEKPFPSSSSSSVAAAHQMTLQDKDESEVWLLPWLLMVLKYGQSQNTVHLLLRYIASTDVFLAYSEQSSHCASMLADLFSLSELFSMTHWQAFLASTWPGHMKAKATAAVALIQLISKAFIIFQNRGFENDMASEKTITQVCTTFIFLLHHFSSTEWMDQKACSGLLSKMIQAFSQRGLIDSLLKVVIRVHSNASQSNKCEIFWQFLALVYFRFPETQSDLLMYLLVGQSTHLVQYLCLQLESYQPTLFSSNVIQAELTAWPLVLILTVLLNQSLIVMTDEEFFESTMGSCSTSDWMVRWTTLVKSLMIDFCMKWAQQKFSLTFTLNDMPVLPVLHCFSQILWKIYFRNSRQVFLPLDFWTSDARLVPLLQFEPLSVSASDVATVKQFTKSNETNDTLLSLTLNRKPAQLSLLLIISFVPFVLPFDKRVEIFQSFVREDQRNYSSRRDFYASGLRVRRGFEFEDGFDQFFRKSGHERLKISFIDEFGLEEAGVDGGGLFKEFMHRVFKTAFDPNFGLFISTSDQDLYPNTHQVAFEENSMRYYEFIGAMVGKALYEGILVELRFATFFVKKWCGLKSYLEDLPSLDPDLYKNLIFLKNYQGNVEELSINFTSHRQGFGDTISKELIPGGQEIPVTNENRLKYIYAVSYDKLNAQIDIQTRYFLQGFQSLIPPSWLSLFVPDEVQILLSGVSESIDVADWQKYSVYNGFENENDSVVVYFWQVVQEMSSEDRFLLLKFVTGCSRPPLFGFRELVPQFCLARDGEAQDRLPTAATCMNMLRLPAYHTLATLKERLYYAIQSNSGFHMA